MRGSPIKASKIDRNTLLAYTRVMVFEWDETKSDTTRSRRGYGFDTAVLIFRSAVIERIDDRFDYGETRVKAIGETGGRIIVVIYQSARHPPYHLVVARQQKGSSAMAIVRKTLAEIVAGNPEIDRAAFDAVTEDDIREDMIEAGQDPDAEPTGYTLVQTPRQVRKKLGMTQTAFARALRIPLPTLQNWEQGRTLPDPAARALLMIVAKEPEAAFRALDAA